MNGVLGAFAGAGGGVFATNATDPCQLAGPFNTLSFNLGVGPVKFSGQFGYGGGTWIGGATVGPGLGVSVSKYPTNTWTTSPWQLLAR
jgi:hypothetical protein